MAWRRGLAYSQDLRERVLGAVDAGRAVREVAPLFRVSISYIYKALERRTATPGYRRILPPTRLFPEQNVPCWSPVHDGSGPQEPCSGQIFLNSPRK